MLVWLREEKDGFILTRYLFVAQWVNHLQGRPQPLETPQDEAEIIFWPSSPYPQRSALACARLRTGAQEDKGTGHQGTASLQADGDEQGVLLYAGHLAFPFRDLQTLRNGRRDPGHIVSGDVQEKARRFRRQGHRARKEHNTEGHRRRRRGNRYRGTMEVLPVAAPDRGRFKIRAARRYGQKTR